MSCCRGTKSRQLANEQIVVNHKEKDARAIRDARITAIVLGFVGLFLLALSFTLFGVGTLPHHVLMGLGLISYLGGALVCCMSVGVLCGMVVFIAIASVRSCQNKFRNASLFSL